MSAMAKSIYLFLVLIGLGVIFSIFSRLLDNKLNTANVVYKRSPADLTPAREMNNVFWFVQVTDIHISRYYGAGRAPDLVTFCQTHLSIIKPDFVLATGDLTDAKFRDLRGSKQFLDEWEKYHSTVQQCREVVSTWLDLRGNHDAFDIPDLSHPSNLFRSYSAQGQEHPSSYVYNHVKNYGRYTFLAADATPNPGPKRPFNFFGYIKEGGERQLEQLLKDNKGSNMTIAFGHYPTSLVAMETGRSIRHLLRNVSAYLCGHLHTLNRLVMRMYARHKTGMRELELGDWRDARIYRVMAIDHDMMSFTDEVMGSWPVVLITNPVEASLIAPNHEPLWRMIKSTHIRLLVFTPGTVNNVEIEIDEVYIGKASSQGGPLYTLPWKPEDFKTGVHTLKVTVQEVLGHRKVELRQFSLDGTSPRLPYQGRAILMLDFSVLLQASFFVLVFVYAGVLVFLRRCPNIKSHYFEEPVSWLGLVARCYNRWLLRMWLVAKATALFYPLVVFIVYIAIGPWFVGDLMDGHVGLVFVWGMYVKNTYLPSFLTYLYGVFQVISFNIPLLILLGYQLHYNLMRGGRHGWLHTVRHIYVPFLALVSFQSFMAWREFPSAYGTRAFLLGPVRTGAVILAVVLYMVARRQNLARLVSPHRS